MKKGKKRVACAIAAAISLSAFSGLVGMTKLGPLGADVVSAATGATTPAKPATTTTKKTTTSTKKTTTTNAKATTQTASNVARILKLGSKGSDVNTLQTLLNNKGYNLKVDGIFGKATQAAVKSFQKENGLWVDGIVGPKTLAVLNPVVAAPVVTPPVVTAPVVTPPVVTPPVVTPPVETKPTTPDVVTTASIVNEATAFEKAISKEGTWIIATLNDLTFTKDLVLEGEFKEKNDPTKDLKRKIAPYTQDDKRNVTARFTITAPKLTIMSPKALIQSGTFKGDLYVSADDFQLVDATVKGNVYVSGKNFKMSKKAKVEGNVYFYNEEAKKSFVAEEGTNIREKQELVLADVVTTASLVDNAADFAKAISREGQWIICTTKDVITDKELVLDGAFKNGKKDTVTNVESIQRKIAPYTQTKDPVTGKNVVVDRFTLRAPKLTIKSPNARIQAGTFKGDLYVEAANFQLVDAKVEGNVYFTTQLAKDTFKLDATSTITGKQILNDVDAVSTASLVRDEVAFEKALSKDGKWLIALLNDLTTTKELVLEGEFRDKNDPTKDFKRKIALYTHDDPTDKSIETHRFTLKAPKLTIKSPKATLQHGDFVGDIYVESNDFSLVSAKVTGNIYFATQAAKDSFVIDKNSSVTGNLVVKTK